MFRTLQKIFGPHEAFPAWMYEAMGRTRSFTVFTKLFLTLFFVGLLDNPNVVFKLALRSALFVTTFIVASAANAVEEAVYDVLPDPPSVVHTIMLLLHSLRFSLVR